MYSTLKINQYWKKNIIWQNLKNVRYISTDRHTLQIQCPAVENLYLKSQSTSKRGRDFQWWKFPLMNISMPKFLSLSFALFGLNMSFPNEKKRSNPHWKVWRCCTSRKGSRALFRPRRLHHSDHSWARPPASSQPVSGPWSCGCSAVQRMMKFCLWIAWSKA